MNTKKQFVVVMVLAVAGALGTGVRTGGMSQQSSAPAPAARGVPYTHAPRTAAEFDDMMTRLSNWGRWGKDDTRGALNLITDATRKQAAALVKSGIVVSLAHDPLQGKAADSFGPGLPHTMLKPLDEGQTLAGSYQLPGHGQSMTHLDALCHLLYKDKAYNGFTLKDFLTDQGCSKLGLQAYRDGIVTRGVLIDMPRLRGVPYLEPGTPVYTEDILEWEKKTGVRISSGDIVFLRTGRWARREAVGPWDVISLNAGFHPSVAPLFKERGVTFVGQDGPDGVQPLAFPGAKYPFHVVMMVALGVNIIDAIDPEAAAATAAKLNRWAFMVTIAPLRAGMGTGIPVNPLAMW